MAAMRFQRQDMFYPPKENVLNQSVIRPSLISMFRQSIFLLEHQHPNHYVWSSYFWWMVPSPFFDWMIYSFWFFEGGKKHETSELSEKDLWTFHQILTFSFTEPAKIILY